MARLIFVIITLFGLSAYALGIEDIRAALSQGSSGDTLEIKSYITVTVKGNSQVMENHLVQFGKEKTWVELKSNAMSQRMIRNGSKMKVIDLKSNKSKVLEFSEAQLTLPQGAQQVIDPIGDYNWSLPEKQQDGLYFLHSDERDIWFDATAGRVTQIVDRISSAQGAISTSQIKYCDQCSLKNKPEVIETQIKINGIVESEMRIEFLIWKTSSSLPSRLFDF